MNQSAEIENEKDEPEENSNLQENEAAATENSIEEFSGELSAPVWSVVSFDRRLARNLTYRQAIEKLNEFFAAKVPGLCIITDAAAERIGDENSPQSND